MTLSYISPTERKKMTKRRRVKIFLAHDGRCGICSNLIRDGETWEIEHPVALILGGSDDDKDLYPVHSLCHRAKTEHDAKKRAKRDKAIDRGFAGKRAKHPMPGSRNHPSGLRKRMSGSVERW